jgi:hypothetical protein
MWLRSCIRWPGRVIRASWISPALQSVSESDSLLWRTWWNHNFPASKQSCVERQSARSKAHDSDRDDGGQCGRHWRHNRAAVGYWEPRKYSHTASHGRGQGNEPSHKPNQQQNADRARYGKNRQTRKARLMPITKVADALGDDDRSRCYAQKQKTCTGPAIRKHGEHSEQGSSPSPAVDRIRFLFVPTIPNHWNLSVPLFRYWQDLWGFWLRAG